MRPRRRRAPRRRNCAERVVVEDSRGSPCAPGARGAESTRLGKRKPSVHTTATARAEGPGRARRQRGGGRALAHGHAARDRDDERSHVPRHVRRPSPRAGRTPRPDRRRDTRPAGQHASTPRRAPTRRPLRRSNSSYRATAAHATRPLLCGFVSRQALGSAPDHKGGTMAAPDPSTTDAGILDGIRIVDLSDGIAGPVATLLLAEAGADVVAVEPPGGAANRAEPASTPGCAASAASCSTSSSPTTAPARPPARRRRRRGAQPRTDARPRARTRRRVARGALPAAHRVVGAVVAGEPCRRRPARSTSSSRWPASACSTSSRATATARSSSAARSGAGARRTSPRSASSPA